MIYYHQFIFYGMKVGFLLPLGRRDNWKGRKLGSVSSAGASDLQEEGLKSIATAL